MLKTLVALIALALPLTAHADDHAQFTYDPNLLVTGLLGAGTTAFAENDKVKHLGAGLLTSSVIMHYTDSPLKACLGTLAIGILKETWDSTGRGNVEAADALATAAGCGFVIKW